jgi:hypothetical protein
VVTSLGNDKDPEFCGDLPWRFPSFQLSRRPSKRLHPAEHTGNCHALFLVVIYSVIGTVFQPNYDDKNCLKQLQAQNSHLCRKPFVLDLAVKLYVGRPELLRFPAEEGKERAEGTSGQCRES